jgi:putative membrane protein
MPVDVTKALKAIRQAVVGAILIAGNLLVVAPAFAQGGPSEADFVAKAVISDMFEIEAGKLAEEKATPNAARIATPVIKDHSAMLTEMKSLVQSGKVKAEVPGTLDASSQGTVDKLKGLKGGAFDKIYLKSQLDTQKENVALFERYAKNGSNGELKSFAAKHLPNLQQHLKAVSDVRAVLLDE